MALDPVLGRRFPVEVPALFFVDLGLVLLDLLELHLAVDAHFLGPPLAAESSLPGLEGLLDGDLAVVLTPEEDPTGVDGSCLLYTSDAADE